MLKFYKKFFCFLLVFLSLSAFKKEEYKNIEKEVEGRQYYFAIPNSFCEYESQNKTIFLFVKCYEIDLEKKGELPFFTEKILIAYNQDDAFVQNTTNKFFAKTQKESYEKSTDKEKEEYFYNDLYPINNKTEASILDDNFIFKRTANDENYNKFITYYSGLYLNKRFFMINWTQYLTKNEDPLVVSKKRFSKLLKENQEINILNDNLYKLSSTQFIITQPRFGNFSNITDLKEYNNKNFAGLYMSLLDNKKDIPFLLRVSVMNETTKIQDGYKMMLMQEEDNKDTKIELLDYKNQKFIKVSRKDSIFYVGYIDLYFDLSAIISLELDLYSFKSNNTKINDNTYLKFLYKYQQQLMKDNL